LENKDINKYLKKSFFTGSVKTLIVSLTTLGLLPLIIASMGMDKYGLVSITMLFGGGVILVDLGISKAVTLLLGKTNNQIEKNRLVADAILLSLGLVALFGILVSMIILFEVPVLGTTLKISAQLYNYIIFMGFITLVTMLINNFCVAILEAYLLMHFVNIGFGLSSIVLHVLLLITGTLGLSDYILVSIPCLSFLLITAYYVIVIANKTMLKMTVPSIQRSKKIIPVSLKFLSIGLVSSIANPLNKYVIILISGNPAIVGIYDMSLKIAFLSNNLLNNLAQPLFGLFSKMDTQSAMVFKTAKRVSLLIFALYCIGVVSYIFIGNIIADYIDFQNRDLLYSVSLILVAGISFSAVSEPFYRVLLGLSLLRKAMIYKSTIILFNLFLFIVLIKLEPGIRVPSAYAIAMIIGSMVMILGVLFHIRRMDIR